MILVNLSCGRNPWKRASYDDSTFRAYMNDPEALRSILPLSRELDSILRRVFQVNPDRRITISALRELIRECPRLTVQPAEPAPLPSPPFLPTEYIRDTAFAPAYKPCVPTRLPSPSFDAVDVPFKLPPSGSPGSHRRPALAALSGSSNVVTPGLVVQYPEPVPKAVHGVHVAPAPQAPSTCRNLTGQRPHLPKRTFYAPPVVTPTPKYAPVTRSPEVYFQDTTPRSVHPIPGVPSIFSLSRQAMKHVSRQPVYFPSVHVR